MPPLDMRVAAGAVPCKTAVARRALRRRWARGRRKQVGWEGGKKRKGKREKSQEQKDERAGDSTAAAPQIPWAAITGDWDISRMKRGHF